MPNTFDFKSFKTPAVTLFNKALMNSALILLGFICLSCVNPERQGEPGPRRIEVLFLGHDSEHHNSARYMPLLAAALSREGINLTYSDQTSDLNFRTLKQYDALIIYANHDVISPSQEQALLAFVQQGGGFIPIHAASYCFRNSEKYIDLVGGQFQKHGTGTFQAHILHPEHPAITGVKEFTTWDETYVHEKLSENLTVLMERVEGDHHEPWTWVKNYGAGRVFYTAYGHDERTWSLPEFHQLILQGMLWAVGDRVKEQWLAYRKDLPSLVYKDVPNIPNYEKRQPVPQYQEPLSPSESQKLIQVPPGFSLELFASEPDIINPIAMDWDQRGRLWVIETVDYPNTVADASGVGDDRIKICEDTDGDGKADKFTLFADNLNIPTSLVFANGGVIVSQAPDFLFLKDTDGDDRADIRETIMAGWGTYDTHAGPSNLKYGIDNQIWGVVGYSGFKGTIANEYHEFGQGVYRFTPDLSSFEFLTGTSNNTWGLGFREDNEVFASTANNTHSVYLGIPNRFLNEVEGVRPVGNMKIDGHYAMHPITDKVRQVDVFGGFTAASGHNFYTARVYPREYWDVALVCEPTGHLVHMARIEEDGAGFRENDGWNIFAGADEWVAPVEAKVGPDGLVWVLDWYNFIVQHNPTPSPDRGGYQAENGQGNAYENPLRDRTHGRVWRLVYQGAVSGKEQGIQLNEKDPASLIDALKSDNMFWRITAQRLIVERATLDILPDLYQLVKSTRVNATGENYSAMHALWIMHGLGVLDDSNKEAYQVAVKALSHPSAAVRKAAVQVLPSTPWARQAILINNLHNDRHPQTRLAALLSLSESESSTNTGQLLYELSKDPSVVDDDWLSRAVYIAAVKHRQGFMEAYQEEHGTFGNTPGYDSITNSLADVAYNDALWDEMTLPQYIEDAGLDMDGVIWFRKTINIPHNQQLKDTRIYLGNIDDSDETWINGVKVGGMRDSHDIRREYEIPAGILKSGSNVIAIKVEDMDGPGGFGGNNMVIYAENGRYDLNGIWKYKVEQTYSGEDGKKVGSLADTFMKYYWGNNQGEKAKASEATNKAREIHISVVKNEMRYDLEEFTVTAGETVEIIFTNGDFMQHNLLIIQPGTLNAVGQAADVLAADAKGAGMQYVPDLPQILFSTPLVDPEKTVKLTFTVPSAAGQYPFVCTFPGHWRLMNGIMKVVTTGLP